MPRPVPPPATAGRGTVVAPSPAGEAVVLLATANTDCKDEPSTPSDAITADGKDAPSCLTNSYVGEDEL
jgi:hypothetical protein